MNFDPEKIWYTNNVFAILLLPISWIFKLIVIFRRAIYSLIIGKPSKPPFVIVVGNITVGGVGKTPFVIWLALQCKASGLRVGIITRGYKRDDESRTIEVEPSSAVNEVGDEALLLAMKTSCPVVVGADRNQALRNLMAKYELDVVISDDGLQHYKLARNFEIAVIHNEIRFGNGFCLPAGPLREPVSRLNSCDVVVSNGYDEKQEYYFDVFYKDLTSLTSDTVCKPLQDLKGFKVHAVAGIGYPKRFFKYLVNMGIQITEHKFPDHYSYNENDLEFDDRDPILMTEKDAVKCKNFSGKDIWYLPITISPNEALVKRIRTLIQGISNG